eukprot:1791471-Prymnesium_polylepis.1
MLNGVRFCGTSGPTGIVAFDGQMSWNSDDLETRQGWEICFRHRPPLPPERPPSPAPPPSLPPPPGLPPTPPQPPPVPLLAAGDCM